ncbi:MAG: hypothetical protein EOO60_04945 [Hymenobacter sp.]|nr:MAG: hypothetical protein EOO60_04945 [Hymenobacter sp.]
MQQHLPAFLEAFLAKPYQKNWLLTLTRTKETDNLLRGMDALHLELDARYCLRLPKGSRQQDLAYVRQALANYKFLTGVVFSSADAGSAQSMPLEEALQAVVGSSTTSIISFIPGKVAYFEGHSAGERYLCLREA